MKLKLKYLLASLVFLYLKKTEFDIVNVSSPYIMMWNTVNESWFLVKYLVKIKSKPSKIPEPNLTPTPPKKFPYEFCSL